ncbi:MAG: hypothetical protein ACK5P0_00900 [bacterium]|jgi:hypothetical protein
MKAIIEFNLDDPDDRQSYEMVNKSKDMAFVLWQLVTNKKKELEYKLESYKTFGKYETLDMVFEEIAMMLQEENIDVDKLIS